MLADARRTDAGPRAGGVAARRPRRWSTRPTPSWPRRTACATDARRGRRDCDVVVVGAGPAGLAAAVYAHLRGAAHARGRARGDRRPGGVELADPQLPRLRARHQRRRAGPARLPAGVGLRRAVPAHARGRRRSTGATAPHVLVDRRTAPRSRAGRWCSPPASPTGGSAIAGARGADRRRRLLRRARRSEAHGARRARTSTSSAAATRPARRRSTSPATPRT